MRTTMRTTQPAGLGGPESPGIRRPEGLDRASTES